MVIFYGNQMNWLVVEPTPLKHMKVIWVDYSPSMDKKNVPNHQPVNNNGINQT
jgi:hypothetical protein